MTGCSWQALQLLSHENCKDGLIRTMFLETTMNARSRHHSMVRVWHVVCHISEYLSFHLHDGRVSSSILGAKATHGCGVCLWGFSVFRWHTLMRLLAFWGARSYTCCSLNGRLRHASPQPVHNAVSLEVRGHPSGMPSVQYTAKKGQSIL